MNVARSFGSMTKSFLIGRTQAFRASMNRDTPAAPCFHSLESYSSRLVPRGCAPHFLELDGAFEIAGFGIRGSEMGTRAVIADLSAVEGRFKDAKRQTT